MVEGGSISHSPLLDGSNNLYWKARMKAFIRALDENSQRSVFTSRKHLTKKDDKGNVTLTPKEKWSSDDNKLANYNFKALNVISNGVGGDQIKLITTYESVKEAQEILQTINIKALVILNKTLV